MQRQNRIAFVEGGENSCSAHNPHLPFFTSPSKVPLHNYYDSHSESSIHLKIKPFSLPFLPIFSRWKSKPIFLHSSTNPNYSYIKSSILSN